MSGKSTSSLPPNWRDWPAGAKAKLLDRLRQMPTPKGASLTTNDLRADPTLLMSLAGMTPDPWQAQLLRSNWRQTLLLCCRQAGKSMATAALALKTALLHERALILLLSPSLRQSGELFRDKVRRLYVALGRPMETAQESQLQMELANGSRIISLPESEETIRGYSGVTLLAIDEASRVSDALYYAVRPMLAVSGGRLVALSTPFGRRGWFWEEWQGSGEWERVRVKADECPRIPTAFLEGERKALGERWYRQEYECSFEETVDAVFAQADIDAALRDDVPPLVLG